MIPKIIHYCWFGRNKKNDVIKHCIESWHKFLPDYKVVEWNEDNFDVFSNRYTKSAYQQKKWAYVSDYVRMYALYKYGGIYLDTDVEMVRSLPIEYLKFSSFAGIEDDSFLVNPGLIYACHAENQLVGELLNSYNKDSFKNSSVSRIETINMRLTSILEEKGYIRKNKKQKVEGLTIFPVEYFCAYDAKRRVKKITENTICFHHYAASWVPWYMKVKYKLGSFLRRLIYR